MDKNKYKNVVFHSSAALEPWDFNTPWETGIGGSETSHIEMSERLFRANVDLVSYAPVRDTNGYFSPGGVEWYHYTNYKPAENEILINYRNPATFDADKPNGSKWWFVAQDVDYPWEPQQLEKVDRYLCLCKAHAVYTLKRYPQLKDRVYISSNGIRSQVIAEVEKEGITREPFRLFYPSSPDRGLMLVLKNWFRIKEAVPKAELYVGYGMENMKVIANLNGAADWRHAYQQELEGLFNQEGVHWLGRLNQKEVYRQWFRASVWPYPNDFRETNCITSMEAQACGAFPVTNALWALSEWVQFGTKLTGVPQESTLGTALWVGECIRSLQDAVLEPIKRSGERAHMMEWARATFDWENVVGQWKRWIEKDSQ
jgi:glycosyltransferase involved in cell wall biosynthesis